MREGDATVFTSADALLLHLVRHPQPLPVVPGVAVLYGNIAAGDNRVEDFDLHFPDPPLPSPVPQTVGKSAVATAVKEHMQRFGGKKLPKPAGYKGDVLEFLAGARIVGLTFPVGWDGKWCVGWHDGRTGVFSAKFVEIEPPRQSEIPMESSSGMKVTARWKWKPKADDEESVWLEFEKGETISNVRCEFLCFSYVVFLSGGSPQTPGLASLGAAYASASSLNRSTDTASIEKTHVLSNMYPVPARMYRYDRGAC